MSRKFAVILGNLGNTCDRFCSSYKSNRAGAGRTGSAAC